MKLYAFAALALAIPLTSLCVLVWQSVATSSELIQTFEVFRRDQWAESERFDTRLDALLEAGARPVRMRLQCSEETCKRSDGGVVWETPPPAEGMGR
jgi:hypothetical protein